MSLEIRRAASGGGLILRDTAARIEIFVAYDEATTVGYRFIDEADRARQSQGRRYNR